MESLAAAYAVYSDSTGVGEVVRTLDDAGFSRENICLMLAPTHPIAAIVRDANIFTAEREAAATTAGIIGWLADFGAVVIPSIGFFIRAQAFLRVLLAARDAPALCGNSRTLAGLGFPATDAERIESQLQLAGFLICVASEDSERVNFALQLFRLTGADESATLEREAGAGAVA